MWVAAWAQQMNSREYNVDQFNVSDLTPAGLGHCINKNILVFSNDNLEPVKVYSANIFDANRQIESDIPVIVAYDSQNLHYESLLPKGKMDIAKCIELVKAIQNGTYNRDNPGEFWEKAKKAKKKEADRRRQANYRSNETPEAKKARVEKDKANKADQRSNETPEAKKARKSKDNNAKFMASNKYYEGHIGKENSAKYGEVKGTIDPINLGDMTAQCYECKAFMFPWESHKITKDGHTTFSLCCSHGKIKLPPQPDFPPILQKLLTGDDPESNEFRRNIRDYNNALSFSSRGISGKPFKFPNTKGPPVYKVSGQIYHCMGNVKPNDGEIPQFCQMYVYDQQHELENRMTNVPGLKQSTLKKLQTMLHKNNVWIKIYKSAAQVMEETQAIGVQMVLKSRTNENTKKIYNRPSHEDIAIIIPNRADNDLKNPRDVILYKNKEDNPKGTKTARIGSLHKSYDPTAYPILFPTG